MTAVSKARMTADIDGDFVVFLIGMRVNKPWKLHKWLPVARAMLPMLRVLSRRGDLGLLGFQNFVGASGTLSLQYWRSAEQLQRFAADASLPHHAAWRAFNRRVSTDGDVGIWHETYLVTAGGYESIYVNMPLFGLARAARQVPVGAKGDTAGARLRHRGRSAVPPRTLGA